MIKDIIRLVKEDWKSWVVACIFFGLALVLWLIAHENTPTPTFEMGLVLMRALVLVSLIGLLYKIFEREKNVEK